MVDRQIKLKIRKSSIVSNTQYTVAEKVTQPRDDGSSDFDVNKFFNQQIMVDHIESFREVCMNHRSHIVEFISTLMQKKKKKKESAKKRSSNHSASSSMKRP